MVTGCATTVIGPDENENTPPVANSHPTMATLGVSGYAIVIYTVTKEGTTKDIVVIEASSPAVAKSVVRRIEKQKHEPATKDGIPVDAKVCRRITINPID